MSTTFHSKQEAIEMGLFYCGRNDINVSILKKLDTVNISKFGIVYDEKTDIYEITASNKNKVHLGIEPFRNGFCLWLINPLTGFARRM